MIKKESEINIKVGVDADHNPEKLTWVATDSGVHDEREVKAMFLSFWDVKENNSMRIDLWNKDLMVEEMYQFVYQNIIAMSETMERATGDKELAEDMKDFAVYLGKKSGVLKEK